MGLGNDSLQVKRQTIDVKREEIITAITGEIVGEIVVTLRCGILRSRGDGHRCLRAIAVIAVERRPVVVPQLGATVSKDEVDGITDGQRVHIDAVAQVRHPAHGFGQAPVARTAHDIDRGAVGRLLAAVEKRGHLEQGVHHLPVGIVPPAAVIPVGGNVIGIVDAILVSLGEPPVQAVDGMMGIKGLNKGGSERLLPRLGGWPGRLQVITCPARIIGVGITGLDNLYLLSRIGALERGEQAVEDVQVAMPVRVVTQADDVIVGRVAAQRLVECRHVARTAHLGVNHNLGRRAYLAASLDAPLEVVGKVVPRAAAGIVAAAGIDMSRGPQHAIGHLVAHLDEVGRGAGSLHGVEHAPGVTVDTVTQCTGHGP